MSTEITIDNADHMLLLVFVSRIDYVYYSVFFSNFCDVDHLVVRLYKYNLNSSLIIESKNNQYEFFYRSRLG